MLMDAVFYVKWDVSKNVEKLFLSFDALRLMAYSKRAVS